MPAVRWISLINFSKLTVCHLSSSQTCKNSLEIKTFSSFLDISSFIGFENLVQPELASHSVTLSPGQTESQVDASWNLGLLATPFGQGMCALALTCDDLRSLWSRSNLPGSQSKFFTVWPPNLSQRKLSGVHQPIISEWNTGYFCFEMVFWDSRVLARKFASPFGHPMQVSTQAQLASTCKYLPVRLTRALTLRPLATTWGSVWAGL